MKTVFFLNGKKTETEVAEDESLLTVLRRLGLHSVRSGCETANCGICTVWVDGKPMLSCSYPAPRVAGHRVTTLEGVGPEADEFMECLAAEGADQCGYCSPGNIMSVLALLRENPDPSDEETERFLSGNLCRCTGYQSQRRAIKALIERRRSNG